MILFVNTVNETITLQPVLPSGAGNELTVCRENGGAPERFRSIGKNTPALTLPPYKTEVWFLDDRENPEKIKEVCKVLEKMNGFDDYGPILTHPQNFSAKNKIIAETGKWINVIHSSWMVKAFMPRFSCIGFHRTERWLQADKDAEVFFGEVDFGHNPGCTLELELAVDPLRAGGVIELWVKNPETQQEQCIASLKTTTLGDWFDFKTVQIPLNAELKGKQEVTFRFKNKGCNLRSWRIVAKNDI